MHIRISRPLETSAKPQGRGTFHGSSIVGEPGDWPAPREVLIATVLAALAVWIEIVFSRRLGLLAGLPLFDGVNYMGGAKRAYLVLATFAHAPRAGLFSQLEAIWPLLHSPLWVGLMTINFFIFGPGEWQSYLVRIWPVSLFLLLVIWVVRRRSSAQVALYCGILTALLPMVSPALNAAAWGRAGIPAPQYAYLADLRPDFFSAVLVVWALAILIEAGTRLRRSWSLASGAFLGLALLCKPTSTPGLMALWGLAAVWVLILNFKVAWQTFKIGAWAVIPICLLTALYVSVGGYTHIAGYLEITLVKTVSTWTIPNPTLVNLLKYFWAGFNVAMGVEGWILFSLALVAVVLACIRRNQPEKGLFVYLGLALLWYALVTRIPAKNIFFGITFYLLLWVFSLSALASITEVAWSRFWMVLRILTVIFSAALVFKGFQSLREFSPELSTLSVQNRATIQKVASDLLAVLSAQDSYTSADWYGIIGGALPYYTITPQHGALFPVMWDPSDPPQAIPSFIEERVAKSKVIYVFKQDMAEVCQHDFVAKPVSYPYYRELGKWVRRQQNGFALRTEYPIYFPGARVDIEMYVRR